MKDFNQFLSEMPRPVQQAKRLGLQGDGHGGWHNRRTGEFVAKTENGKLTFYNKRQRVGRQDPAQTEREKKLSATSFEEVRDLYVKGEIFNEGDWVRSEVTEQVGKIIRRGTNYLICVTEDGNMFKPWIKDVTNVSTMVKEFDWVKQFINKYRKNKEN
jgi:hypothetical protein